jgi:hypothetical protein
MSVRFRPDAHLFPLYAKFAADCYRRDDLVNGNQFFRLACDCPRDAEHKIYRQMYKIKSNLPNSNLPNDPEAGRKAFWDVSPSCTSTPQEKAQAIDRALRKCETVELQKRERKVYECLRKVHKKPRRDRDYGKHAFNNTHGYSTSFEDKFAAARMYADESRPFSWIMDNEIVHLIKREDGELETLIVSNSQKAKSAPFDRGTHPIEEAISLLKGCDMTVQGDFVIPDRLHSIDNFNDPFHTDNSTEIKLFRKGTTLIWHEHDKSKKAARWIDVNANDVQRLFNLTQLSNEDRESVLEGFAIARATEPGTGKLMSIYLKKIVPPSKMDPSKTVDRDNWSVTLISEGVSSACGSFSLDPGFGHAKIIYEGVKKGAYFIKQAHLTNTDARRIKVPPGYARLAVGDYTIERNEINARTQTWIRPRILVQKLKEENRRFYLFNHTGSPSFSPQLLENLKKEITYIVSNAVLDTLQEAASPTSSELAGNRIINAFVPNDVPSFPKRVGIVFVSSLVDKAWNEMKNPRYWVHDYNCLTILIKKMSEFGMSMPPPNPIIAVPNDYIRSIAANPSLVRINET